MIPALLFVLLLMFSTGAFTYSVTRLVVDNFMSYRGARILPAVLPVSLGVMVFSGVSLVLLAVR